MLLVWGIATPVFHQRESRLSGFKRHPPRRIFSTIDALKELLHKTAIMPPKFLKFPIILNVCITKEESQILRVSDEIVQDPGIVVDASFVQEVRCQFIHMRDFSPKSISTPVPTGTAGSSLMMANAHLGFFITGGDRILQRFEQCSIEVDVDGPEGNDYGVPYRAGSSR